MANIFTFKKEPRPSGLMSVGWTPRTDIKHQGKECGSIHYAGHHRGGDEWGVMLQVIKDEDHDDGNPNCKWMWISLTPRFDSEPEARQWLQANGRRILKAYKLHLQDD